MSDDRNLNKHLKAPYTLRNLHLHKPFENPGLSVTIYEANQQYQHIISTSFIHVNSNLLNSSAAYLWHSSLRNCKLQSRLISSGRHAGDILNSLSCTSPGFLVKDFLLCRFCAPSSMRLVKAPQCAHPHGHTSQLAFKGIRSGSTKVTFFHLSMVLRGVKKILQ